MKANWTNRKKILTKAEIKHLTHETACRTKAQFQDTINAQEKMRKEFPDPRVEPCWDCRAIAKKLNIETN